MSEAKIHYSGAIRFRKHMRWHINLEGWAACCSDHLARAIRASGRHTQERANVTCLRCAAMLVNEDRFGVAKP